MAGENLQERKRISETYGRALYDLAVERGELEPVREQMSQLWSLMAAEPDLVRVFDSTLIQADDRDALLDKLNGLLHPLVRSFLGVMNRRNRLGLLPEVVAAFDAEDDRRNDRVRVKLETATEVDKGLMVQMVGILRNYLLKEPIVEHRVRPELLGGFVAQAGDFLIDGSVKTKLAELQKRLLMRGEDEIQG